MAHRSRLSGFIIDCKTDDLDAATDFWAGALGCSIADRDAGDATAAYQMLGDTPGDLHIEVQKVPHPSRVHLDIEADDVEAEVERLKALGATEVVRVHTWVVMEAPTGHRFCVVSAQTADFDARANSWP